MSADQIEGENSLHVVREEKGALLDGVVVCGGDARSRVPEGMINTAPGTLAVTNCTFVGNRGTLGAAWPMDLPPSRDLVHVRRKPRPTRGRGCTTTTERPS